MTRARIVALAAVGWAVAMTGSAQAPDPLLAVGADPSELARVAARLGDDAILERLGPERPLAVRLAAVRACPFLVGPEAALEALAELAAGRHPRLAPAAAASLLAIADATGAAELSRREASVPDAALEALDRLAADETARPDLRAVGAHVAAQLRGALGFASSAS